MVAYWCSLFVTQQRQVRHVETFVIIDDSVCYEKTVILSDRVVHPYTKFVLPPHQINLRVQVANSTKSKTRSQELVNGTE